MCEILGDVYALFFLGYLVSSKFLEFAQSIKLTRINILQQCTSVKKKNKFTRSHLRIFNNRLCRYSQIFSNKAYPQNRESSMKFYGITLMDTSPIRRILIQLRSSLEIIIKI